MIPIQQASNGAKSSAAESISTVKAASSEEQAIVTNEKYSVRQFSPNSWGGFVGDAFGFLLPVTRDLIGPYGTFECDLALRTLAYAQHGGLWGGATKIWTQKALGTPYEISGGRNQTYKWQDIFAESDFGEGYDFMMDKAYQDLLTLNRGMFLEKVSYGASDTPIRDGAQILALNHLDAMRIYFTGNREFPYLYSSEWNGQLHKMHYTRVIHIALSPSPNTRLFGIGRSALYDALTVANSQLLLGRHQNELLSDLPPTGIVLFTNVKAEDVKVAMEQFDLERRRDGQNVYRAPLQLNSKDPAHPATVQFIPMATVPEGFDYEKYMATHVNLVALALQLDPQDIWPLVSLSLGTGQQSKILEMKSESKGPGYILTLIEREFNKVLPRSLEWKFKAQNTAQDTQIANTAKVWTDIANSSTFMTQDEKRQLIADQVPAFADVLLDENGVVRLYDADPKEQGQETIATDNIELDNPTNTQDITATDATQLTSPTETPPIAAKTFEKNIDATNDEFIQELTAIIQDGIDRTITKAGCAARIRGAITRYGKQAYLDGLEHGCVDPNEFDDSDALKVSDIAVHSSQYVSDMVNQIYSEEGMIGTAENRAQKWMGTTDEFYYAGIQSADSNGLYEFTGDDGKENCATCAKLKGQRHRMKWWIEHELRPGIDHHNFECGTWSGSCNHYLERVDGC